MKSFKQFVVENTNWCQTPGTWIAYRAGSLDSQRGIFFADNLAGAQAYSSLHGVNAKKYSVTIHKPLVTRNQYQAAVDIGLHPDLESVYKVKSKANSSKTVPFNNWFQKFDKKIKDAAQKKGYDCIVYTDPMPPADKELLLFRPSQAKLVSNGF